MSAELPLDRLVHHQLAESGLTGWPRDLVLAALDGEDAVRLAVERAPAAPSAAAEDPADSAEVYLASVSVRGFRGIGETVRLPLDPGPGLTLVTGRNGSAKSSIAESVEMALTGRNSRWDGKADATRKQWQGGWRNLHTRTGAAVEVQVLVSGTNGATTLRLAWADGAELDERTWTVQAPGGKRVAYDGQRWRRAFEVHRPFLSYTELGRLVDSKPAELHDVLHRVLGLEALDEAKDRLREPRLRVDKLRKEVKDGKTALLAELAAIDDDRAREAHAALARTAPPLDRLTDIAVGGQTDDAADLRALAAVGVPSPAEVAGAVSAVEAAEAALDRTRAAIDEELDDLYERVLGYHDRHGDSACPVCEVGTLDAERRAGIESARRGARSFRSARAEHHRAFTALRALAPPPPSALGRAPVAAEALAAWQAWHQADQRGFAEAHRVLVDALALLHKEVGEELGRLDEVWRPAAVRLSAWIGKAGEAAARAPEHAALTKAEKWYKDTAAALRDARMRPFAEQTRQIYRVLRQSGSVTLEDVVLAKGGTLRRAELDVRVDGEATTALGVMSQGELHALGLALFLPRARVEGSPLRFIVVDDPVQAMDPSKVDGLAQVLAEVAATRQVVVFTHDDRLTESLRRQDIEATIWDVVRGERSSVTLERSRDAVDAYLADAWAIAKERADIPDEVRREIAATCCRSALEAAAHAKVRRVRLARGIPHHEVDAALTKAVKTTAKLTLALFDDDSRQGELMPALDARGRWAADTVRACKQGAHRSHSGDLLTLIDNTRRLAAWIAR
jgi:hypothetical protein